MKTYTATFWRGNPQLRNGGYEKIVHIEAKTETIARTKAKKMEKCAYGTMTLINLQEESNDLRKSEV